MAEPRVTITLGRSGQVVKRGVTSGNASGSKRSGEEIGSRWFGVNKRQHGDGMRRKSPFHRVDAPRIGRNDLRLKLIRKSLFKQRRGVNDERRKTVMHELSKAIQPPPAVSMLRQSREPKGSSVLRRTPHEMAARQTRSKPITLKAIPKPYNKVPQEASASNITQKSLHMEEEPLTVASLLRSLGLDKYAILFRAEEVDMTALRQMKDKDLKELGIPMGPRKKILLALMSPSKQCPA